MKLALLFSIIISFLCQNTFAKEIDNPYAQLSQQKRSAKEFAAKVPRKSEFFKQKFTEVVAAADQDDLTITEDEMNVLFGVLLDEMQIFLLTYIEQQQKCADDEDIKERRRRECEKEVKRFSVLNIKHEEVQDSIFQENIKKPADIINQDKIIDNLEFSRLNKMGFGGYYLNTLYSSGGYDIPHH